MPNSESKKPIKTAAPNPKKTQGGRGKKLAFILSVIIALVLAAGGGYWIYQENIVLREALLRAQTTLRQHIIRLEALETTLAQQQGSTLALRQRLETLEGASGQNAASLKDLSAQLTTLPEGIETQIDENSAGVRNLRQELTALQRALDGLANQNTSQNSAGIDSAQFLNLQEQIKTLQEQQNILDARLAGIEETSKQNEKATLSDNVRAALEDLRQVLKIGGRFDSGFNQLRQEGVTIPPNLLTFERVQIIGLQELKTALTSVARTAQTQEALATKTPTPESQQAEDGLLANFLWFLKSQVQLRPLDAGDETTAIFTRMQEYLNNDNITAALGEANTLNQSAKQGLDDWLTQAQTHAAAQKALNDFATGTSTGSAK